MSFLIFALASLTYWWYLGFRAVHFRNLAGGRLPERILRLRCMEEGAAESLVFLSVQF